MTGLMETSDLLDDLQNALAVELFCASGEGAGSKFDDNSLWLHDALYSRLM